MARLTDDELRALTDAEMQDALAYCGGNGKLAIDRQRAEYYFQALAKGDLAPPEIEGRSSVVDTTVRNTVLGMHAPLMKVFCGTENVVEFEPTLPDDEQKAKQATEYLNYVLRKKCSGYQIIYTWIFDALKSKKGFIKVWWDDSPVITEEEYRGQTIEQLALLLDDEEVEITGQKAYEDADAAKQKARVIEDLSRQTSTWQIKVAQGDESARQMLDNAAAQIQAVSAQPVPMLYDVTLKRTKKGGKMCIDNVPPEEMFVSRLCKHIDDDTFKAHRVVRTLGQLKAAGYKDVDDLKSDDFDMFGAMNTLSSPSETQDIDSRRVWLEECYVHANIDGSGRSLWKIVRAGGRILDKEKVDANPFVDLDSIPLPHTFFGFSPADLAMQTQKIKTSLKRVMLDNMYLQVNGRTVAVAEQVNLDDLLNSRPGGVVRVKSLNAVAPLQQGMSDLSGAMAMSEATEIEGEEATGWTRQSQGGSVQVAQTATQSNIVTNRADSRVEMIARTMAETGFTLLFKKMLRLITRYQDKDDMVQLSGGWTPIDPREWTNQFDLTINVGLGTGNKDQQIAHLGMLKQNQMAALQIGYATPENLFNADKKLVEALGFKSADAFFTDPSKMPPKPPQQDPAIVKAQLDDQAHQREVQLKQQQAQMEAQLKQYEAQVKSQAQMETDRARQEVEAQMHSLKLQYEAQFQAMKEQNRAQEQAQALAFQQYKLDKEIDAKIVIAQIAAKQAQDASLAAAEAEANKDVANDGDE